MVPVPPPTSRSESFLRVRPVVSRGDRVPQLPPHAVTALREKNHLPRPPTVMNCGHALTATTSQAVTNRLADRRIAAATAAPPDEATPTEPRRYILRPSLPRRRVGQLQVAGDGAAAALKGVPPCSSQVLPPAEPGSGRVAPSTNHAAYTWRVVGESAYSASIRCSVVRPSQQARFSHPPPRWPTEDGAPTWRESPGPVGAAHEEPRENKARVGLPMVAELVVEQDLLQCAAAALRPRCRRPVATVRVDRRQRGGPFIVGCAGGHARTTPRHAWACGAGRGLCTRPLGGRRAAARHLGSSSAGMQPGAPRASSARSPSFPSLGNGRQR
jgi:hypothetical protein